MAETIEIFKQFAEKVIPELQAVSKRFADSIGAEITEKEIVIYASPYISVLIDGRAPTDPNAEKGSPTLQQILRKWIDDRSIVPRPSPSGIVPTLDQLSWMMSNSMHMHGDLLYQRGGGNNIFDPILTEDRIDSLLSLIGDEYFNEVQSITFKKAA